MTYQKLLDVFWRNHDPLAKDRQFCDRGDMYRAGIFYHDDEQQQLAEETEKDGAERSSRRAWSTPRSPRPTTFYKAEDYHQDYYKKNPVRYKFYRFNCGRDQRLEELWGKTDKSS